MRVCVCTDFDFSYALYVYAILAQNLHPSLKEYREKVERGYALFMTATDAMMSTSWCRRWMQCWAWIDVGTVYITVQEIDGKVVYSGKRIAEKETPHKSRLRRCVGFLITRLRGYCALTKYDGSYAYVHDLLTASYVAICLIDTVPLASYCCLASLRNSSKFANCAVKSRVNLLSKS